MVECTACHTNSPSTITGGPHGLHPVGPAWVSSHPNLLESGQANRAQCQPCHGLDYRGTVLSRMKADRTLSAFGTKTFFSGATIGCYNCHQGPGNDSANTNAPPTVANVFTNTTNDQAIAMVLPATGTGLTLSIVSQCTNGTVGLSNGIAIYFPNPGFVGTDRFTFAAYDGSKNSNLGTGTVTVVQGPFSVAATALVPHSAPAAWPVAFTVVPSIINNNSSVAIDWDYGDGSPHGAAQYSTHIYALPGTYSWSVTCTVAETSLSNSGSIEINAPMNLAQTVIGNNLVLAWPATTADVVLETSPGLGPSTQWSWVTNSLNSGADTVSLTWPISGSQFFRLRRPW
jgi:hypothetical protein